MNGHVVPTAATIDLGLPAQARYMSVLRSTVAALAARLDFTLEEIDDLRIAIDEAGALLLNNATPNSQLQCRIRLDSPNLTVSVSAPSGDPMVPARRSFAWTLLSTLTDAVDADDGGGRMTISLRKAAQAAHPKPRSGEKTKL